MKFARRNYKSKRKGGFKPRAKKSAPIKTKSGQVALIKKVIARMDETKFRSELTSNVVAHNSSITFPDLINLLPKLVQDQGTGSIYERLGRKISVRNHSVHMEISVTPDVDRSTNIVVCVWILQNKNVKNWTLLSGGNCDMGKLLLSGSPAETQGFNGFAQDQMLPVNTGLFQVIKHFKFPLGKNTGNTQDDSTPGNQPTYAASGLRKSLYVKLPAPKVLTYDQDTNSPRVIYYPNGYAPFAVVGYYHADQSTPDILFQDVTVTTRANLWFDDA